MASDSSPSTFNLLVSRLLVTIIATYFIYLLYRGPHTSTANSDKKKDTPIDWKWGPLMFSSDGPNYFVTF